MTVRRRIGWVAGSGEAFIRPIMAHLAERHDVIGPLTEIGPELKLDLLWVEWADGNAVTLTNAPKLCPIIVRLHSFEAFADYPKRIAWPKVDALVYVADHVRDFVTEQHDPKPKRAAVIPNGVDLERFTPAGRGKYGQNVAWVGTISAKKGPELFAAAVRALLASDSRWRFHVVGAAADPRYGPMFKALTAEHPECITFYGEKASEEMPEFFRGMDYVLSTSPWESFQYSVAEGIASGCIPLVHEWPGARAIYPKALLWKSIDDLVRQAKASRGWSLTTVSHEIRRDLERFRLQDRLADIDALVDEILDAGQAFPSVALCMIGKGDEARLRGALESVAGHVDEMIVCLDTRGGSQNADMCRELGAAVTTGDPLLWNGHFDFAANRNKAADLATSEWALVLDSDELLENPELIRPMVAEAESRGCDSIAVQVDCYLDTGLAESAQDVRLYRRDKARYRYPVHNQLTGQTSTLGTQIKIRSTYVGGLLQRCDRSIPPLELLYESSASGAYDPDATVNEKARRHAAFFLTRMYAAAKRTDKVIEWGKVVAEICGSEAFAAPAWTWYAHSTLITAGDAAARDVIAEGLARYPRHPDLIHQRIAMDFVQWYDACADRRNLPGTPFHTRHLAESVGRQVAALMKLPVEIA